MRTLSVFLLVVLAVGCGSRVSPDSMDVDRLKIDLYGCSSEQVHARLGKPDCTMVAGPMDRDQGGAMWRYYGDSADVTVFFAGGRVSGVYRTKSERLPDCK